MKSVLVTGSSVGGIGAALCREFQRRGLHVFATARTPSKVGDIQTLPNVTVLALDVTSSSSIAAAKAEVEKETGGRLDYLINNSGAQYVMPILDVDIERAKAMYEVNVWGVIAMIQAFAPLLIATKGSIVNIASLSAYLNAPYMGPYGGSKAAIDMIGETLRLELAPFDVKVITCVTGAIQTNIMTNSEKHDLPSGSLYAPVAEKIYERARGDDIKDQRSSSEDFAERLVRDVLGGATGKVYRGKFSSLTRFTTTFLPTSILDGLILKGTGLDKWPGKQKA